MVLTRPGPDPHSAGPVVDQDRRLSLDATTVPLPAVTATSTTFETATSTTFETATSTTFDPRTESYRTDTMNLELDMCYFSPLIEITPL